MFGVGHTDTGNKNTLFRSVPEPFHRCGQCMHDIVVSWTTCIGESTRQGEWAGIIVVKSQRLQCQLDGCRKTAIEVKGIDISGCQPAPLKCGLSSGRHGGAFCKRWSLNGIPGFLGTCATQDSDSLLALCRVVLQVLL